MLKKKENGKKIIGRNDRQNETESFRIHITMFCEINILEIHKF